MRFFRAIAFLLALFLLSFLGMSSSFSADTPKIPNFWDPQERFIKPDVKSLPRLKFLTTTDFAPFSFIDKDKRLSGFHVDLARAICTELEVLPVCQIQAVPYEELEKEMIDGNGEAILAGLAPNAVARQKFAFSRPYFQLPARFVSLKGSGYADPLETALNGKEVGVIDGRAHAAYAKASFGDMRLRLFETSDAALAALKKGEIAAYFGDGLALSFWLQQQVARGDCCEFVGGPYLSQVYFGKGLTIAIKKDNRELEDAFNFALRSINDKGIFAELYLRYFPLSLF